MSLGTFCSLGRFVPGTFFPLGCFVPGTLCLGTFCSLGRFVLGRFVCAPTHHTHVYTTCTHSPHTHSQHNTLTTQHAHHILHALTTHSLLTSSYPPKISEFAENLRGGSCFKMTTILTEVNSELCSFVSFHMLMLYFAKYETYETGFRMQKPVLRKTKFFKTRSSFGKIQNLFRMKFSRILYERNSIVNPSVNVKHFAF